MSQKRMDRHSRRGALVCGRGDSSELQQQLLRDLGSLEDTTI